MVSVVIQSLFAGLKKPYHLPMKYGKGKVVSKNFVPSIPLHLSGETEMDLGANIPTFSQSVWSIEVEL